MPNCIYCGADDVTLEHHVPRALGNFKGYVPLEDRVCTQCNGVCGQLDEQLCRSGPEAFFRQYHGITGRRAHQGINPFYRGSAGGGRLEMFGTSHQTGEEKELELVRPGVVKELRCAKLVAEDGSTHTIPITDGMVPDDFRKKVTALGIKFFKHGFISAAPEEIPWVESLFAGFTIQGKTEWVQPVGPITYGPLSIKVTVDCRYFRAIAKIAFHYFLTKFPRFRGDEPPFSDIRNFIMDGCLIDEIGRFVTQSREQFVYQLRAGDRLRVWGHMVGVHATHVGFQAKVQLFAGPENRSTVFTVRIGDNPSPIHYSEAHGDSFIYYPPEECGEFDGEVCELHVVTRP